MTDSQKLDLILSKVNKIDEIKNEMKEVKTTLRSEMEEVKTTLRSEIEEVKTTLRSEIEEVKTTLQSEMEEVKTLRSEIGEVKTNLESEIKGLKEDVKKINVILENEIRPNIQRIAEGHLDLSRNLHEVMKYKDEIEILSISRRFLESEVQELKRKIS